MYPNIPQDPLVQMEQESAALQRLKARKSSGHPVAPFAASSTTSPPSSMSISQTWSERRVMPPPLSGPFTSPPLLPTSLAPTKLSLPRRPKHPPYPPAPVSEPSSSQISTYSAPSPRTIPLKPTVLEYDAYGSPLSNWTGWHGEGDLGAKYRPGTAAYYKSYAFRKIKNTGGEQVPGHTREVDEEDGDIDMDDAEVEHDRKTRGAIGEMKENKELVMVFSLTNVRREKGQRKVGMRLKKYNRRMKQLRRMDGVEERFGWD